jgi:hypothetical protein
MKDFRTLPPAEKLEEMANVNFWRTDSHYVEEYMLALICPFLLPAKAA